MLSSDEYAVRAAKWVAGRASLGWAGLCVASAGPYEAAEHHSIIRSMEKGPDAIVALATMRNMPAASPPLTSTTATDLAALGQAIKMRRHELGFSMVDAARNAGVSRVTLHRVERGNPSVTMGAYAAVAGSLGLQITATLGSAVRREGVVGENAIRISDYPQLKQLAWNRAADTMLSVEEALALYERNWRHVDQGSLNADELELIRRLTRAAGHEGKLLV